MPPAHTGTAKVWGLGWTRQQKHEAKVLKPACFGCLTPLNLCNYAWVASACRVEEPTSKVVMDYAGQG